MKKKERRLTLFSSPIRRLLLEIHPMAPVSPASCSTLEQQGVVAAVGQSGGGMAVGILDNNNRGRRVRDVSRSCTVVVLLEEGRSAPRVGGSPT